ncbi:threonine synthase [Clostridium sp.]|uniref:threonine synthase n=1 Tax=Clostridium sp. TaxID=1506 RepID=UPI0025857CE2|nr:threonine synthase [Clostridium sp.]MDF2504856.1 thrC2 [Clostridium sp.]
MSYFSYLQCSKCGKGYSKDEPHNLCECGGPLLVRYDLHSIKENVDKNVFKTREKGLFRFKELLPIEDEKNIVSLGEGDTPILKADRLGDKIGAENLYIKDEGLNPTGTFKSRGAAVGVSKAKELGIKTIAMPTAGNAGGAWSAYSAKAGIELVVAMPEDAPDLAKKEAFIYGSRTYLVKGLISDAGKIIAKGVKKYGWFDAATLKEPYRIEGKKTMGFEIAEYFNWEFPDAILYPTGGGVGIIGIWKAFKELKELGWIKDKIPKLIAVQAEGCNPIVNVRQSKGTAIEVKDFEIIESLNLLAKTEGMFVCPEGATLVAAADKLIKNGFLKSTDKIVLLNTGSGLKYANLVEEKLPVLEIDADI